MRKKLLFPTHTMFLYFFSSVIMLIVLTTSQKISDESDFFGAVPSKERLVLHNRQSFMGNSKRLGAVVNIKQLNQISEEDVSKIMDAVRAHGVVIIKKQNLTLAEQTAFTSKLGKVVMLPPSFIGDDPQPLHPAITRVCNFWTNDTWKGPNHSFGAYWHQVCNMPCIYSKLTNFR